MKPSILLQLDTDPQPSVFDGVVAVDAGVDHLFRHGGVTPDAARNLVYGALFTRGGGDLQRTAIFIGGSDVSAGEALLKAVKKTFFADFRVSVLFDANGCNTTAAAAVLAALEGSGGSVKGRRAAVLGGTGPVGQRVARLLARLGASVALGSRILDKAKATAESLKGTSGVEVDAFAQSSHEELQASLRGASIVVTAGTTGVELLPADVLANLPDLKVAIDLNAVPPLGIAGISVTDRGTDRSGVRCWGALGVGGTKMKIHRKAIAELFTSKDKILDAEEILEIGQGLG